MSELHDWLRDIALGTASGLGGAFAWFRGERKLLNDRMDKMEGSMKSHADIRAEQTTEIAVLHVGQANISERLDRIERTGDLMNGKLDTLISGSHSNNRRS